MCYPSWDPSGLTEENIHDLERIQKSACKLILQDSYKSYDNALKLGEFTMVSQPIRLIMVH